MRLGHRQLVVTQLRDSLRVGWNRDLLRANKVHQRTDRRRGNMYSMVHLSGSKILWYKICDEEVVDDARSTICHCAHDKY